MAISTDAGIEFFGTQDTVTAGGGTSSVTNTSFSVSGDVVSGGWTNDDDAKYVKMVGAFTFSTAPGNNTFIHLYARPLNIDGTNDPPIPDANNRIGWVGAFFLDQVTSAQYPFIEFKLPNFQTSQIYEFYIENRSGQTLSAGWTLKITPAANGPHA